MALQRATIAEVIDELAAQLETSIELDEDNIFLDRILSGTVITFECSNLRAGLALELLMESYDLGWIICDDFVLVTISELSEQALITTTYQVGDLVTFCNEELEEEYHFEPLIYVILATNPPSQWQEFGGNCSITQFQSTGLDVLAIDATRETHEEIYLLLQGLRQIRNQDEFEQGPRPWAELPGFGEPPSEGFQLPVGTLQRTTPSPPPMLASRSVNE